MINIVVFASGSGTNFQSIINAVESGQIEGQIRGLITNRAEIEAINRAQRHDIAHATFTPSGYAERADYHKALLSQLADWNTDLIVLAGYLLKIPVPVIDAYSGRIINIHPSLLPKYGGKGFYGINVHRAVIESGDTETGCTVHIVTEEYDEGPVLAQQTVPVHQSDDASSLAGRVLEKEHELFPKAIAKLANELNSKNHS
ncbi:MAG TPA: phosphoribosylglycinamide formyltransferase [Fodinibius sp.]|nr:phosphoribosylglycinamide formyltransferase [Fodinibius sp.]